MRKRFLFAAGTVAAVATATFAAGPRTHVMTVGLPEGGVARIEYVGDVAPKVTIAPSTMAGLDHAWTPIALPSFAGFDRMIEQMNRQSEAMIRQAQQTARQAPGGPGGAPYVASFSNLPAGVTSTSVVSVSNGGGTCTRTTEVVSQGPAKPPKVTNNVSGDCSANAPATPPRVPRSSAAINRT